ncbi:MAG: hypothetical protein Roseis3KO_40890 [Roseivirga sp.]
MKNKKMKIIKYINGLMLMVLAIVLVTSCEKDEELFPKAVISPKTVAELIADNPSLSTLGGALERLNLDSVLSLGNTYTVFAPNNAAFSGIDLAAMTDAQLEAILLNHVRSTTTADFVASMATGYTSTMSTGPDDLNLNLHTNVADGAVTINGVGTIVSSMKDLGGTNGVVHVVDGVLLPPTVVDHVDANPEYSTLSAAIAKAELTTALSAAGPFTLFAPSDAAFEQFMAAVNGAFGWSSLDDIPAQVLRDVLMYHVVADENIVSGDVDGIEPATLQGDSFSVSGTVISDASYTDANIILTDVQGVNGIVHGIDKVLLPDAVFQSVLSATLNLVERTADRGFTAFAAAAAKVNLSVDLGSDELTAFIPNNDAFVALFATIDNYNSLDDFTTQDDLDALKALLEYHLYAGSLMTSSFTDGGAITTVNGDDFTVDLSGDDARLRPSLSDAIPSTIVNSNIGATNGVIHEINRVLVPSDLAGALGIDTGGSAGLHPVGDPELVFFDWDGKNPWWGNVGAENNASLSLDGGSYGRANFQTGGTGWQDLFWRNDASTFNGAATVGSNLGDYSLKFDLNVIEPLTAGRFRIRFNNSNGVDAFYDWSPWEDSGDAFTTDGWITIEIPLTVLGQPDFSLVNAEFGMAFEGADVLLNFAIDNVRFDTPGNGGPDPVDDENLVFFNWNGKDPWWGNVAAENDAALTLDGEAYGRANFQTGGTGWQDLFWRNGGTLNGAATVGTNINDYDLKFDINVLEPINDGMFRIRFNNSSGVDAFYNWAPWDDSGEAFETNGWTTITIPCSLLGQPDFSGVDQEFGMAFEGADILLNFAIDNVRFEQR